MFIKMSGIALAKVGAKVSAPHLSRRLRQRKARGTLLAGGPALLSLIAKQAGP
jgi:hypothetical protein